MSGPNPSNEAGQTEDVVHAARVVLVLVVITDVVGFDVGRRFLVGVGLVLLPLLVLIIR